MIISLISQKGGVGKSALSRLIAVEYAKAGWAVKIGDLDTGQGSTAKWKARRDQNGIAPEIPVEKYATVDRAINDAENYDLMVLDGPAFAERRGLSMAQASDLIIMPTGYSLDDMDRKLKLLMNWKTRHQFRADGFYILPGRRLSLGRGCRAADT